MNYTDKALTRLNAIISDCSFVKVTEVTPSHITILLEGGVHVIVKENGDVSRSAIL